MRGHSWPAASLLLGLAVLLAGCGGGAQPVQPPAAGAQRATGQAPTLTGAGATFPFPLYSRWFEVYQRQTGVRINYQSIGSGAGIRQVTERTVDFGASDAPMTDEQLAAARAQLLHVPTVIGAVVVTYNLPGIDTGLKLTPATLAGIFLGQITRWSDPRIAQMNPGWSLPDTPMTVVQRSDGSGTTNIFTDYLSAVSPAWQQRVGKGTSVNWPVGLGGKGNEGVTGQVKQSPGSIGYVELAYAVQNKLPYAFIQNQAGQFVEPTLESITAAAAGAAASMPEDLRVSIVNAPGAQSYPIAGFTYLLVYQEQTDSAKGKALVDMLWWAIHDGQAYARDLLYAPLPAEVVTKAEAKVNTITYQGRPLRGGWSGVQQ
ncbi:MAG: phosphate ABC transporter substrate-binding protein PstS [Chloroflexi bacterium]|nr:phosphate ABC transporter substrate-binding protein PstS [Chloroflexota bacterium]